MIMGYSFEDIENFRFIGNSGLISKFVMEPDGKRIAYYVNHKIL